ncbi:MAG: ATP-dependent RecD-like DNA helicase [Anaerolineae bacterium]|nr:ATP-dependent RecD-like DNA helicase [Anaerolineae bacterium]
METIEGVVEDIIYYNEENGYTVLSLTPTKAQPKSESEEIVVVGKTLELHPGESIRVRGDWAVHKEYGQQFKADTIQVVMESAEDVRKYLASGLIPGIGKEMANRIVKHFGAKAVDILDANPERMAEVPEMTPKRATVLANAWMEARGKRRVFMFLQNYGFTPAQAEQIYNLYGDDSIDQVNTDPYQLAIDIEGVGFKLVDQIASNVGIRSDAPERVIGGVIYALGQLTTSDGHTYAPRGLVVDKASELLGIDRDTCDKAVTSALRREQLVRTKRPLNTTGEAEALYLPAVYKREKACVEILLNMKRDPASRLKKVKTFKWDAFFSKLGSRNGVVLSEQQQAAVHAALNNKISVLTGGPGTGKTTTLRAVIEALETIKAKYALASPTGRAARRLNEATGREASTLHRLLGYTVDGSFVYDSENPLEIDMLVIDETSMVDLDLFSHVLEALPSGVHLLLVGDVDQLPSVGAGNVLHDIIDSGVAFVTRLDAIFRQANDSLIVVNAHRVNHGEMPDLTNTSSDFFMFGGSEGDSVGTLDLLIDVVRNRIPRKFGFDPLTDVQVLAPMYKGEVGIHTLNERLQDVLNPAANTDSFTAAGKTFRIGDKVIQTRNNYELEVYNGDIGRVLNVDSTAQTLDINMDGRIVTYKFGDANDLFLAYAISIHRSQGGEYPAVVIPVVTQHYRMLQRKLIYTAITRAKKLVVLVGQRRAIQIAVENANTLPRYSGLGYLLASKLNAQ